MLQTDRSSDDCSFSERTCLPEARQGGRAAIVLMLIMLITLIPAASQSAQAQDEGEAETDESVTAEEEAYPTVDFAVNVAQAAQYLTASEDDFNDSVTNPSDGEFTFQRVRFGVTANVQFSERISAIGSLEEEPDDFQDNQSFAPSVDFVALDFALDDNLTLRAGTPVTAVMNFRALSDGPVVQANPLIGNSPADMLTAASGVQLIGAYETVGFDVTVNSPTFFQAGFDDGSPNGDGLNFIGRLRYTGSDRFKIGAGAGVATGSSRLVFQGGDSETYFLAGPQDDETPKYDRLGTQATIPGEAIFQADAQANFGTATANAWGGYGTDSEIDASGYFLGLQLHSDMSRTFYAAAQGTYVDNTSDGVDDNTSLYRIQGGIGVNFFGPARLKVSGVYQAEGINSLGSLGSLAAPDAEEVAFYGVLAEISAAF